MMKSNVMDKVRSVASFVGGVLLGVAGCVVGAFFVIGQTSQTEGRPGPPQPGTVFHEVGPNSQTGQGVTPPKGSSGKTGPSAPASNGSTSPASSDSTSGKSKGNTQ